MFNSIAKTWDLIREVFKDVQKSDDKIRGYENALKKGVFFPNEILIHSPEAR